MQSPQSESTPRRLTLFGHIVMQTLVAVMQPDAFREAFALEKTPVTIVFSISFEKKVGLKGDDEIQVNFTILQSLNLV